MVENSKSAADGDSGAAVGHDVSSKRTTAPMSEFAARDAAIGTVVFVLGLVIAFGVPLVAL